MTAAVGDGDLLVVVDGADDSSDGDGAVVVAVVVDGGFDATNPADGARYQVRPNELTISSNGHVDSAEAALEYGAD